MPRTQLNGVQVKDADFALQSELDSVKDNQTGNFNPSTMNNYQLYQSLQGTGYSEIISTPSSTWNINHGLGTTDVIVAVYDSSSKAVVPDEITISDGDNVTISFAGNESGYVVVSTGSSGVPADSLIEDLIY